MVALRPSLRLILVGLCVTVGLVDVAGVAALEERAGHNAGSIVRRHHARRQRLDGEVAVHGRPDKRAAGAGLFAPLSQFLGSGSASQADDSDSFAPLDDIDGDDNDDVDDPTSSTRTRKRTRTHTGTRTGTRTRTRTLTRTDSPTQTSASTAAPTSSGSSDHTSRPAHGDGSDDSSGSWSSPNSSPILPPDNSDSLDAPSTETSTSDSNQPKASTNSTSQQPSHESGSSLPDTSGAGANDDGNPLLGLGLGQGQNGHSSSDGVSSSQPSATSPDVDSGRPATATPASTPSAHGTKEKGGSDDDSSDDVDNNSNSSGDKGSSSSDDFYSFTPSATPSPAPSKPKSGGLLGGLLGGDQPSSTDDGSASNPSGTSDATPSSSASSGSDSEDQPTSSSSNSGPKKQKHHHDDESDDTDEDQTPPSSSNGGLLDPLLGSHSATPTRTHSRHHQSPTPTPWFGDDDGTGSDDGSWTDTDDGTASGWPTSPSPPPSASGSSTARPTPTGRPGSGDGDGEGNSDGPSHNGNDGTEPSPSPNNGTDPSGGSSTNGTGHGADGGSSSTGSHTVPLPEETGGSGGSDDAGPTGSAADTATATAVITATASATSTASTSSSWSDDGDDGSNSASHSESKSTSDPYWYADRQSLKIAPTASSSAPAASSTAPSSDPNEVDHGKDGSHDGGSHDGQGSWGSGSGAQPAVVSYPTTIVPSDASFVQPSNTTSIAILFNTAMPWTWVVSQADLTAQIFGLMPGLVSSSLSSDGPPQVTTVRLQQYSPDGSNAVEQARSLYVAYIPTNYVDDLQNLIANTSSPFYTAAPDGAARQLAQQVDPEFNILTAAGVSKAADSSNAQSTTTSQTVTLRSSLIGVASSLGGVGLLAAGYVVWKRKQRRSDPVRRRTIHSFGGDGAGGPNAGLRETWAPQTTQHLDDHAANSYTAEGGDMVEVWRHDLPATSMYYQDGGGGYVDGAVDGAAVVHDRSSRYTERSGTSDYGQMTEAQRIQWEYESSHRSSSISSPSTGSHDSHDLMARYQDDYQTPRQHTSRHATGSPTRSVQQQRPRRRGSVASSIIGRPEMTSNSMLL